MFDVPCVCRAFFAPGPLFVIVEAGNYGNRVKVQAGTPTMSSNR
jgi:hypothetical protein